MMMTLTAATVAREYTSTSFMCIILSYYTPLLCVPEAYANGFHLCYFFLTIYLIFFSFSLQRLSCYIHSAIDGGR